MTSRINWNDPRNNSFLPDQKHQGDWSTVAPTFTRKQKVRKGLTNLPKNLYRESKIHTTFGIKVKG